MAKQKLKGLSTLNAIKARLPSATPSRSAGKGPGVQLMAVVPAETMAGLRARAGAEQTTVRALILDALHRAGYPVPADELKDRRRTA